MAVVVDEVADVWLGYMRGCRERGTRIRLCILGSGQVLQQVVCRSAIIDCRRNAVVRAGRGGGLLTSGTPPFPGERTSERTDDRDLASSQARPLKSSFKFKNSNWRGNSTEQGFRMPQLKTFRVPWPDSPIRSPAAKTTSEQVR